jgi:hypothetical protein
LNSSTGYYSLTIKDFSFGTTYVGDIVIDSITSSYSSGSYVLTRAKSLAGPTIGEQTTVLTLGSSSVTSGTLALNLTVSVYQVIMTVNTKLMDVPVAFTGSLLTTGIQTPKSETIALTPSVATDYISVPAASGEYQIYNTSGVLVKSGKLTSDNIKVSTLPSGVYILSVGGKTAKFIKK